MSPRRLVEPGSVDPFRIPDPQPSRRGLALASGLAAVILTAALTVSAVVFADRQMQQRTEIREAAVLSFVRSFIAQYTSPNPFNANEYADNVLALGTGSFATLYKEMMDNIVIQVAQAEPAVGVVKELGISQWNDDGSATVVAVANMTTKMPDGQKVETASRWEVTAVKEGEQWKVSDLIQVI